MMRTAATRLTGALLGLGLLLVPALARAQAREDAGDRPDANRWSEVERGLYVTGTIGAGAVLNPPVSSGTSPRSSGLAVGVGLGYDLLDVLQLELFVNGAQVNAPPSYVGLGGPADPRGDFTELLAGGKLRFAFVELADVQGIDRVYLGIEGGGGVTLSDPQTVFGRSRPTVLGGLFLRYYTQMRHFSVGLDVDAAYALGIGTVSVIPQLALAYTF